MEVYPVIAFTKPAPKPFPVLDDVVQETGLEPAWLQEGPFSDWDSAVKLVPQDEIGARAKKR